MARRRRAEKRKVTPDPKYHNVELAQFINKMMLNGKKTVAQRIVYDALDLASEEVRRPEIEVFEQAIRNTMPMVEVRSRRVGGATYQVPTEVRPERRLALSMRWIIQAARSRRGRPMSNGCPWSWRRPPETREPPSNGGKTSTAWRRPTARLRIIVGKQGHGFQRSGSQTRSPATGQTRNKR